LVAEDEEAAVIEAIEMKDKSVVYPHCGSGSIVRNGSANGMLCSATNTVVVAELLTS